MPTHAIYTLRYRDGKSFDEYLLGLKKAELSAAQLLQIDWRISETGFLLPLIAEAQKTDLRICFKCNPKDIKDFLKLRISIAALHIFFKNGQELESSMDDLQQLAIPHEYVLNGDRDTNFEETIATFQKYLKAPLYFYFSPFDKKDKNSLAVREVAKALKKIRKKFPLLQIQSLPGLDLIDSRIHPRIDLEPLIVTPDKEIIFNRDNVKFSFIIPTYNNKYFLLNTLVHVFRQNYPREAYEVLVVDDGSNDDSMEFVVSYLKTEGVNANFRYYYWPKPIYEPMEQPIFRAGLCRNIGANNAVGEFLVFLDSDILIPTGFLLDLEKNLSTKDVVQYVRHHIPPEKSNSYVTFKDLNLEKDLFIEEERYWRPFFEQKSWPEIPFYWKYTCTYCLALKRHIFIDAGRFRRIFVSYGFEDTDLGFRLHKRKLHFHLSKMVTLHLTPPRSSHRFGDGDYRRFIALRKTAKLFFLSNLDIAIYTHFEHFMGGEPYIFRRLSYALGKFLKRFSNDLKKSEI